jgi:toxin ParE1/3/4
MAEIIWTQQALDDLKNIGDFVERSSPHYAEMLLTKLYYGVVQLEDFPMSGRKVPEMRNDSLRELIMEGYRVVYEVTEVSVHVIAVIHGRQSMRKQLSKRRKKTNF